LAPPNSHQRQIKCYTLLILIGRTVNRLKTIRNLSWSKLAILLVTLAVVVLTTALMALPVSADPGLTVSNAVIVANVTPGQTLTWSGVVSIAASDPATMINLQVEGMTQAPDGTLGALAASEDTGSYTARPFISIDQNSFPLNPGASQTVTATIQVPQDVGAGQRFAMINLQTQATPGNGVNTISAVNVPVYLTIIGSQMINTGTITSLSTGSITTGQPITVTTNFENTGNYHFKIEGQIAITSSQGMILDTIGIPETTSNIMPGLTRQIITNVTAAGTLSPGTYTIDSRITLSDGTPLDEKTTTFTVSAPYVPPPSVGTIKLDPSSASMVKNADGTVSVAFPQGAAVVPVEVSVQPNPNQLAAFPAGYTAASTTFEVNGLTGLLAKEATVTVKYTADDLSKAGGDASKLKLMLWNQGTSQWVPLKTKVDSKASTLSATSNQMGIFAVAVGTSSSGMNWMIIGIIAVVIIVIAIVAVLLIVRRKPAKR
jgi:hypothetical protein